MPRIRGELGHSGVFGYVAVAVEIPETRAAEVLGSVQKGLRPNIKTFGHEALRTKPGEPYTQFTFVATRAKTVRIEDEIGRIAENISSILAQDGHDVETDPKVYAFSRTQPLLRERPPEPAAPQASAAAGAHAQVVVATGPRAPRAPTPGYATAQARTSGAAETALEL